MNRFIRFEYNDKKLPLIDTDKSFSHLTLELALEPVLHFVDKLDYYIKRAKNLCHHSSMHGLTEDESAAVYIYTDDWGDQSLNRVLNQILQSEDRTNLTPWMNFLKLFNTALKKLPTVTSTIWRGLPIDIAKNFEKKEELIYWGVTSCSTSIDIIKGFISSNKESILCSIKPFNGKDVRGYTPHDGDNEVLLLPGIHLRVKSMEANSEMDKFVICLEEISVVDDEPEASNDITMFSSSESTEEDDKINVDYSTTKPGTATNQMDVEPHFNNAESKKNENMLVITFSYGDRYEVAYKDGKKQDNGKYYSIDGGTFEGQDADDKANGEGICVFPNGDRFIGTFKHSNRHGHGIFYHVNGSIRAGNWIDDESVAQYLEIKSNSDNYEWRDESDEKRWYRAYLDGNGNKYIGNIIDGKANGLGLRVWSDGNQYEGNFKNNKKHGYGIYYYTDRDKYMGQWANDEINGDGVLTWTSGTCYEGSFVNGKRHGQGKLTFSNKRIQEGYWDNDLCVS